MDVLMCNKIKIKKYKGMEPCDNLRRFVTKFKLMDYGEYLIGHLKLLGWKCCPYCKREFK